MVTPGAWELRPAARRMPWPAGGDLRGLRCLDVGTMDGFWAFEMERRGAAEVVALDLLPSFHDLDVHDLDSATHGRFDLVFMGYVAELLHDPIGAFRAIRRVCRGTVIIVDQVSLPLSLTSGFLRDRPGPGVRPADFPLAMRLRHGLGLAGVSLALRARPRLG